MNGVKETLLAVRSLVASPQTWIKGSYEKDGCYCLVGAVHRASEDLAQCSLNYGSKLRWELSKKAISSLQEAIPRLSFNKTVTEYNDHDKTTHQDILNLIDTAIAKNDY